MVIYDMDEAQLSGLDEGDPPPPYDDEYDEYLFWYSTSPPILAPAFDVASSVHQSRGSQSAVHPYPANQRRQPIFSPRLSYYVPTNQRPNIQYPSLPPPLPTHHLHGGRLDSGRDGLSAVLPLFPGGSTAQFDCNLAGLAVPPTVPPYSSSESLPTESEPARRVLEQQGYSTFFRSGIMATSRQVTTKLNKLYQKIQHALDILTLKRTQSTEASGVV